MGVDALVLVEAGLELDIDHVLLDFCAEGQVQSAGNLQFQDATGSQQNLFGSLPILNVGPAIRIGYRFW